MASNFIDYTAPSLQADKSRRPEDLPHGLVPPPTKVRELLAQEKAKHPSKSFSPETEERMLNEWTLDYYFDYLGHEVLYRQTPNGPEVHAVGFDEICARTNAFDPEKMKGLETRMPS
jgi:hypothetical protein